MEELDAEPTAGELSKAIDSLASGKAPGSDGIPPYLIKHCKATLLQPLHGLLCQCWKEGAVPQDMSDSEITHSLQKTRVKEVTAITTEASPFSASSAKPLLGSF